jgi:acyl-CoA reductase-like NAD-dependent aldehyde dehydrogenase/nicotinamidase-related amidase
MRPLLLLVDLQNDFLQSPELEECAGRIVEQAALLLEACRRRGVPVVHAWTTVSRSADRRMPHWKAAGKWLCEEGTPGHEPPAALQPVGGEPVVHKTVFSAFSNEGLDRILREAGAVTVWIAGVYLHSCVRQTVLDAHQRGFTVVIVEDAVASNDPLHAASSRRYLETRAATFAPAAALATQSFADPCSAPRALEHRSPRRPDVVLWPVAIDRAAEVQSATEKARQAWPAWAQSDAVPRAKLLERLAERLEKEAEDFAAQMAEEVGKPLAQGRGEVLRTAVMLRAVAGRAGSDTYRQPGTSALVRQRPLGVVALITPWNNPVYIPVGKIAPALLFGNTVVWKPAPAGTALANRIMAHLEAAGFPHGTVTLVTGDQSTARLLMEDARVDGVALTGSSLAGYAAQEICGRRRIPLQAELGGNNAAIVWADADLAEAARLIAEGAFGMAGQRCTANRRVVVDARCSDEFVRLLREATAALGWGDPLEPATQVGPLISAEQRSRVAAAVARATPAASRVLVPHGESAGHAEATCLPPTIICCDDRNHEIVQEETFGPVLVVQRAASWEDALALCNGVRQGLVAALFTHSPELQEQFLFRAGAGILKINRATADAEVDVPFCGWKASGIGPAEHGACDREFYTRTQTVYGR